MSMTSRLKGHDVPLDFSQPLKAVTFNLDENSSSAVYLEEEGTVDSGQSAVMTLTVAPVQPSSSWILDLGATAHVA